jgi:undecaprenyl pyrophosphate phosphatase UppP
MSFSAFNELLLSVITGVLYGGLSFTPIPGDAHVRFISSLLLNGKDITVNTLSAIEVGASLALMHFFWKEVCGYLIRIRQILLSNSERTIFLENINNWRSGRLNQIKSILDIEVAQLLLALIPILIVSFFVGSLADTIRSMKEAAWICLGGTILFGLSEYLNTKNLNKIKSQLLEPSEALLIGMFGSLGVFVGISQVGIIISAGLLLGRKREFIVKFCFGLLSLISILKVFKTSIISIFFLVTRSFELLPTGQTWVSTSLNNRIGFSLITTIVGSFSAFIVSWLLLPVIYKYLLRNSLFHTILYRIVFIAAIIIWLSTPFAR